MDQNYLALKLASKKAAATPLRKAISMDRPANVYKPRANHAHKIAMDKQKESQGKLILFSYCVIPELYSTNFTIKLFW